MADVIDLIRRVHQHRNWVNQNLLTTAEFLTGDSLLKSFEIGQGSVWKSLIHLYAAEYVWLGSLQGDEFPSVPGDLPGKIPGNQLGEGGINSLSDLREKWTILDREWSKYLNSLTAESLDELVYKVSSSSFQGQRLATRRSDVLLHVCTHAQYTAAQVVNMFRQLGVNPLPETMLVSMARREGLSAPS